MRYPKLVAALAALTLTVGGLALAGPALAADEPVPAPTTEVASSPDISTPSASSTPTGPASEAGEEATPTTPSSEPAESGTPTPPSSDVSTPPTEPTESGTRSSDSAATPSEPSSPRSTPSTDSSTTSKAAPASSTAKPKGHDPVTICHKPGDPAQQTLTVDDNALKGHLGHGDTLGECVPIVVPPTPTPVEGWWLMPNGGTGENVTWPQAATEADVVPCGVTAQVDLYPSAEVLATLAADGILEQGEDYSTVISWRFVYGGDCPPRPEDSTSIIDDHETTDCDAGLITHVVTEQTTTYTWNADTETWDAVLGEPVTTATTRQASAEDCPVVVVPPTEPPVVVTPPTTPTPTPSVDATPTPVAVETVSTERLASTGSETDAANVIGLTAGGFILLGVVALAILRRRTPKQK